MLIGVVACALQQQNPWLVALAFLICAGSCFAAFFILETRSERSREGWLFLAATLAGGGAWATHFIAMLGFKPGIPLGFNLTLTLVSAASAVAGAWGALTLFARLQSELGRISAGLVWGVSIAAMHFLGMASVDVAAERQWAPELVGAACLFSAGFSIAALHAFSLAARPYRSLLAAPFLITAILSLHFTAMGALTLIPDPRLPGPVHDLDRHLLATTIAIGAAAILLVAVVLTLAEQRVAATELAAARQAAAAALHDALTGLPNRRHLKESLPAYLDASIDGRLAVIAVDLDRFKPINDLYGHGVGDLLLVKIAKMLTEEASDQGLVARLGGDEFILVLPFVSEDVLIARLSALAAKFEAPIELGGHEVSVGATFGVALSPADGLDPEALMRRADIALYRAKDSGRGGFAFFEADMDKRVEERAALENDLRVAVRHGGVIPHFQPLVDLASGEVQGYEILARWRHPIRGPIDPAVFIKIAEETGLIGELTLNLLARSCRETLDWPGAPRISLNIAPIQMKDPALPQKLLKVLAQSGFPARRLEIEITEEALISDFNAARAILISLKNLGVAIALDDFGTGYSSLRHLRELPFDQIKIDQSFVHSLEESQDAATLVRTIVQMAKGLGLAVTAEGVETEDQARRLKALGCERGQGFMLGEPAEAARFSTKTISYAPAAGAA
ncbi:MAG: EAL domain-containing protein [Pseudomonadota bacterium]